MPSAVRLWLENDEVLTYKIGMNRDEFDFVWRQVSAVLVKHYELHHAKREPPLSPFASLLATLYYLRHYPTARCLAAEFDTTHPTIDEDLNHTLHALFITLVPACFSDSRLPHRGYCTGVVAGVKLVVDSTFLILPHHGDADERKTFYHPKSPTRQGGKRSSGSWP